MFITKFGVCYRYQIRSLVPVPNLRLGTVPNSTYWYQILCLVPNSIFGASSAWATRINTSKNCCWISCSYLEIVLYEAVQALSNCPKMGWRRVLSGDRIGTAASALGQVRYQRRRQVSKEEQNLKTTEGRGALSFYNKYWQWVWIMPTTLKFEIPVPVVTNIKYYRYRTNISIFLTILCLKFW